MASAVLKSGKVSLATLSPPNSCRVGSGLICGADIVAGDPCYIKSDGLVYPSDGTAANAAAKVDGWAVTDAKLAQNDAVTLLTDIELRYGAGLTPGQRLFLDIAANYPGLATAATTGGTAPVAFVIDATTIRVFQSKY